MNTISAALHTDRYELSMLGSVLRAGAHRTPAVFELFARRLPAGRRFGLLAGVGRALDHLDSLTFAGDDLDWLAEQGVIDPDTAGFLRGWRFTGDIDVYREGSLYWPGSPVVQVRADLASGFLLETLLLSVYNHDSAIASAAARMVLAAGNRPLIEMGSRRVHEEAAVAAARAAYIAGFASTSNLAAGRHYGVPTAGTAAHAFVLAHDSERAAFEAQMAAHGPGTTILVDTFDTATGIRTAVEVARAFGAPGPGAVRIDSGDLAEQAHAARALLDSLGATTTRIVLTSDIDEYALAELAATPADGYGVGTRVSTGSGHPSAGFVYKLVAIGADRRPVQKTSAGKASTGGAKIPYAISGSPVETGYVLHNEPLPTDAELIYVPAITAGARVLHTSTDDARVLAAQSLTRLDQASRDLTDGAPAHHCTRSTP